MSNGAATPLARSPIQPVMGVCSSAYLTLADCSLMTKVLIHASPEGRLAAKLGTRFGEARLQGETLVVRAQPNQWLLLGPPGDASAVVAEWTATAGDEFASVIDVTSGRALLRLTGEEAPALLAKVCSLDLDAADGSAARSSVARVSAEIIRDDTDGHASFLLACDRSYGQYFFDALLDAGGEFSIGFSGTPRTPGDISGFDVEDGSRP